MSWSLGGRTKTELGHHLSTPVVVTFHSTASSRVSGSRQTTVPDGAVTRGAKGPLSGRLGTLDRLVSILRGWLYPWSISGQLPPKPEKL